MAEEKQEQERQTLEQLLLGAGSLHHLSRKIDSTPKPSELYGINLTLAGIASRKAKNKEQAMKSHYEQITRGPAVAQQYATEMQGTMLQEAEPLYQRHSKEFIDEVVAALQEEIKGSKDKSEAALRLSAYFTGLMDVPKLDQLTADEYAQAQAAEEAGISINFTARGHIADYQGSHEREVAKKIVAGNYLKDVKEGDKTRYELDAAKVRETMANLKLGAVIYTNYRKRQEEKAKAKQSE